MPAQDPEKAENSSERPSRHQSGRKSLASRYNSGGHDVEAQISNTPASPFPGTSYGFHPADQPTQPPRRVASVTSLRRAHSFASLRTDGNARADRDVTQNPEENADESVGDKLAWNPSHPCFPHPNPHVPLSSLAYDLTRIIRIKRDWMAYGDIAPAYSNIYPEILDPLLPESEFRFLINHVNRTLHEAFNPFSAWNWVDGTLGLLTGWLWEDFRPSGMKGKLKGLEFWIEQWNQRVGTREGVRVIPLRRTGYMSLDIEIPDPQVRVVDPDDEEEADGDVESHRQMRVGDLMRGPATIATEEENRMI